MQKFRRTELKTVCRIWTTLVSFQKLCRVKKRLEKNACTRGSLFSYLTTARYARSTCRTRSVVISCKLRSRKLANTVIFNGIQRAFALALIKPAIFFAKAFYMEMINLRYGFTWNLPMLTCTRKYVVFIASTKWASNARVTSVMTFDAAFLAKTVSMID